MQPDGRSGQMDVARALPLLELLECPPSTGNLLTGASECLEFDTGEMVFEQLAPCRGLYIVISGQFLRKTVRMGRRLILGTARAGELVELAATLGDGHHNYALSAKTSGSMLLLPTAALSQAFQEHPPLRMRLLEELAREVSRSYHLCRLDRSFRTR